MTRICMLLALCGIISASLPAMGSTEYRLASQDIISVTVVITRNSPARSPSRQMAALIFRVPDAWWWPAKT